MKKQLFTCLFIMYCIVSNTSALHAEAIANTHSDVIYSVAVVPQFTGLVVHRDWTPIINYLNENTPYQFKLKLYQSIPDFERSFVRGEPDIAYMNPYHAVIAKKAQNYRPIIRDGARELTGILVVRKDSRYQTIQDLNGTTIAFPSPNSFAASLYMRALLKEKEGINFETLYTKTHSNAYRHVLLNKTQACGAVKRTLKKERKEVSDALRILYKTPSTPSHPITAHARVPVEVSKAIQEAFVKLASNETTTKLLSAILIPKPVFAEYDRDYAFLEKLKLDSYLVDRTQL